jgi:hypothetical protein
MKTKNPRGKETSLRVGSAAGRLLAKRKGRFLWVPPHVTLTLAGVELPDVTDDVLACAGSANVQRQLPRRKRKASR